MSVHYVRVLVCNSISPICAHDSHIYHNESCVFGVPERVYYVCPIRNPRLRICEYMCVSGPVY